MKIKVIKNIYKYVLFQIKITTTNNLNKWPYFWKLKLFL